MIEEAGQPGIASVEASMWKEVGRVACWIELDCAALGLSCPKLDSSRRNWDDSPPWVVSIGIWIITRSGESYIDLLMRNISIISSGRTIIYMMHRTIIE